MEQKAQTSKVFNFHIASFVRNNVTAKFEVTPLLENKGTNLAADLNVL